MSVYIRAYHYRLPEVFEEKIIAHAKGIKGRFGVFNIPKNHAAYPDRSDAKIMRADVIAAIIVIKEMLGKLSFSKDILTEMGLFVANGSFLEEENKHMKRVMKTLRNITETDDQTEKLRQVYKSVPPLTALETLTNSTMSFIAKYTGVKGNNTTFGNTSYGGFSALSKGIEEIRKGDSFSLAGGANGAGVYSALSKLNFYEKIDGWQESAACAFLVLQKEKNKGIAEITACKQGLTVPSLTDLSEKRNWSSFFNSQRNPEMIVYSGGATPDEFLRNKKEITAINTPSFSWNEQYGSLGAAALPMNVIKGLEYIEEGKYEFVDILDRDIYGRETYLQVKKI